MNELATTQQQPSMMEVIARISTDPNVNVETMGKLVELQFRIMEEQKTQALNEALAKLEPMIEPLAKSKPGAKTREGKIKYYYTPYEEIDRMLRPLLRQCGLSLSFSTRQVGDKPYFVAQVQEVTKGGIREAMIPYAPDANDQLNGPQKMGSGTSYAKRYAVGLLFNLVTETDDDGAFAGAITAEQVGKIERLITELGENFDAVKFAKYLAEQCNGISEVPLIPAHKYDEVYAALLQKKERVK